MRRATSTTSTMTRTWTRAKCTTPEHALRARSLRHTLMLGHMLLMTQVLSVVMSSMYMCVSLWVHFSHSLLHLLPLLLSHALRAAHWARQIDRHAKHAPFREQKGLRRPHLPHRTEEKKKIHQVHSRSPLESQLLHQERATPRAPSREEAGGLRVLHREFAQEEMQEKTFLKYSRPVHPWGKVPQEHDLIGSQWKNMSWDGQIGERKSHAPHHSRWNSSLSKQLVDPFEHSEFRHDAREASIWFSIRLNNLATAQEPGRYSSLPKLTKFFLILGELTRILVVFFIWASPRRWTEPR